LRVFFDGLRILQAHLSRFALALRVQQAVVRGGDLEDELAMGVIELEVGDEEVGLGDIDAAAAATEVKDKILDVKCRLEEADGLAMEAFADQRRDPLVKASATAVMVG